MQVYKALRGGVQDVAVKQLLQQEDGHSRGVYQGAHAA